MTAGPAVDSTAMHAGAIATAAVVSAACALVGTLLVVRRLSLLGDAISHAVLPGIAVAILSGARPGGLAVFAAAVACGLATVGLSRWLGHAARVADDAGAGVVFTALFAVGVVIVSVAGPQVDLDASCVLYGILEMVPFDTVAVAGVDLPRGLVRGAVVLAALVGLAAATWKLQVFTAFDPEAARAAGIPVAAVTTGLLAATAVTTVAGFEIVGSVLVVSLLVIPAAAAELLVHRLHLVAVVAMGLAVAATVVGYLAAYHWNTAAAGMIAVVLAAGYVLAAVAAPRDGLAARGLERLRFAWRVACEDRLATIWRAAERGIEPARPRGALSRAVGTWLRLTGRIIGPATLSAAGRREAEMVVRSHRLWEAWLGRNAELPLDHLHPPAEWVEHHLGAAVRQRIQAEIGGREGDPHGRDIPPEA